MENKEIIIQKAVLLSPLGTAFLKKYLPDGSEILSALQDEGNLCNAIVKEALTVSAGKALAYSVNDGMIASGNSVKGILSVFNKLNADIDKGETTAFSAGIFDVTKEMCFPCKLPANDKNIIEEIQNNVAEAFNKKSPEDMSVNEIMYLMENLISHLPVADDELGDISLFDYTKLASAFAAAIYRNLPPNDVSAFEGLRQKETFLLVSGDVSGIQQFIYTITTKGALKSLRGRSFYLEILIENIVDEILSNNGLNRTCLLYTGGGHFYMLLPNTEEIRHFIDDFENQLNGWFLKEFGTRLYIAIGCTPCCSNEFMAESKGGAGLAYRRVSSVIAEKKIHRYNKEQLLALFNPDSDVNSIGDGQRECGLCHTSALKLKKYQPDSDTMACPNCRNLFKLGEKILKGDVLIVSDKSFENAMPVPGFNRKLYLNAMSLNDSNGFNYIRRYIKNGKCSNEKDISILFADHVARYDKEWDKKDTVVEFEELSARSGGSEESTSIKRLGILRADVDNLGAAFMSGFSGKDAILTRSVSLSRQLSIFFKCYVNQICHGNVAGLNGVHNSKFMLFEKNKKIDRDVHIIYSGGDDMFIAGSWDDLIEVVTDIRKKFSEFTNNKLSFSAGIGIFNDKTPVGFMAKRTGLLEDYAKDNPGKNSVALFGVNTEIQGIDMKQEAQVYSWNKFINGVCGEKLKFIKDNINYNGNSQDNSKIPMGKSALYRLLELLERREKDDMANIARFAYTIARMNPGNNVSDDMKDSYSRINKTFYNWYRNVDDCRELYTAITFIIYSIRDKGEKK